MNRRSLFRMLNGLLMLSLVAVPVWLSAQRRAGAAPAPRPANGAAAQASESSGALQPANYCAACHTAGDPRPAQAVEWRGGPAAAALSPCPAYRRIQEELYYTERLLLMIDRASVQAPMSQAFAARLQGEQEGYLRLLDAPVVSLDAFVAEAQGLRYKLGKDYTEINQVNDQSKRRWAAIVAGAVSLLLALSLGWGWFNTRHYPGGGLRGQGWPRLAGKTLLLLAIFAFFALPLLQEPAQPATATSAEAQAIQTTLDTATRAASAADRAGARAWMLGQIGAVWNTLDPQRGAIILAEARQAAGQANDQAAALWGQAAAAQEAAVSDPAQMEKAGLVAARLDATRSRAWGLRLAAEAWLDDPAAAGLLEQAADAALSAQGGYRDLDLGAITAVYARLDPLRAGQIAKQIQDPALQASAWRAVAAYSHDYSSAVQAARRVSDPYQRALTLGRIAAESQDAGLFVEAAAQLPEQDTPELAYTLSALAGWSGDPALAGRISAAYPTARAVAYLGVGDYTSALQESQNISDPYEQAHVLSRLAQAQAKANRDQAAAALDQIQVAALRQRAARDLLLLSGESDWMEWISWPYLRLQAYTSPGSLDQAQAALLANPPKDGYPLVGLTWALAGSDPQAALALVEQMPREADRSAALNAIALQTGDPAIFERALGMAQAARVRSDPLAPARASLDLALAFIPTDPVKARLALEQAYQIALAIPIR